jgi:hypothetical protein
MLFRTFFVRCRESDPRCVLSIDRCEWIGVYFCFIAFVLFFLFGLHRQYLHNILFLQFISISFLIEGNEVKFESKFEPHFAEEGIAKKNKFTLSQCEPRFVMVFPSFQINSFTDSANLQKVAGLSNTTIQMSRRPGTTSPTELKSSNRSGKASGMIHHPVTIPKYLYTNDASGRSRNAGRKCLRDSSSGEDWDNALAKSLRKLFNSVVPF